MDMLARAPRCGLRYVNGGRGIFGVDLLNAKCGARVKQRFDAQIVLTCGGVRPSGIINQQSTVKDMHHE
jgi:hypothetical protein